MKLGTYQFQISKLHVGNFSEPGLYLKIKNYHLVNMSLLNYKFIWNMSVNHTLYNIYQSQINNKRE